MIPLKKGLSKGSLISKELYGDRRQIIFNDLQIAFFDIPVGNAIYDQLDEDCK